jgi:hypothetical protein
LLGPSKSCLGRRRAAYAQLRLVSCARRALVVGHAQATSRLTKCHLIGQGASHQLGRVPPHPIHIEWGKGEGFSPHPSLFPNCCGSSLIRGRERAFIPFLRLFSICCLSSFLLAKSVLVPRWFLGEKGVERGRGETHRSVHESRVQCRAGGHLV